MRTTATLALVGTLALAASACSGDDDGGADDFVPMPPTGCETSGATGATWPAGPYGTEVGDTLADLVLTDCDDNSLGLADIAAGADLILFNVGAGWCQPCIEETETLDAEIFRAFCPRGLRVVQVVFQDEESRRATSLFCREWRARYTLSFPVLYDPLFVSDQYFDSVAAQTPLNFLVDPASGEILFVEAGSPAADLPARIDAMLPN